MTIPPNNSNITKRSVKTTPLSHDELDANFQELKNVIDLANANKILIDGIPDLDDLQSLLGRVDTLEPQVAVNEAMSANNATAIASLNATVTSQATRISVLEGAELPAPSEYVYTIQSLDAIPGGSSGTDNDIVISSPNATPQITNIQLKVKYILSTGFQVEVFNELRTLNYQRKVSYDLLIPIFRNYNGVKITHAIIEVWDDPNIENSRTNAVNTKSISIIDPTASMNPKVVSVQTDEGATQTVVVDTINMETGKIVNYEITSNDADVTTDISTVATGELTVTANAGDGLGSVSLDVTTDVDLLTEGDETLTITFTYATDDSITATQEIIINDTSRATETWTIADWTAQTQADAGNTITDIPGLVGVFETFRFNVLALETPSDLYLTSVQVFLLILRKSWIEDVPVIPIETDDQDYIRTLNGYVTAFNDDVQSYGAVNEIYDHLVLRPSDSDNREDDIAFSYIFNNPTTSITPDLIIYTGTEENPNDL